MGIGSPLDPESEVAFAMLEIWNRSGITSLESASKINTELVIHHLTLLLTGKISVDYADKILILF